jgi:outer membrane protein insertion porin family
MFHVFFLSFPCDAAVVGTIDIRGLYSLERDEFLAMFGIQEGSMIDEQHVREGIKRTFLKGVFDDIAVEVSDDDIAAVNIKVIEKDFIDHIRVDDSSALSDKTIKSLFALKESEIMRYDLIKSAGEDLKDKIIFRGYPDTTVSIDVKKTGQPHRVDLLLRVTTGTPLVIKKVMISGSDSEVANKMKLSEGDVYDQEMLKDDFLRVKEYLLQEGYFRPFVGPYLFEGGILNIQVKPGKKLKINIIGNEAITTKTLLKEVPFFEIQEFDDDAVDEAVNRMLAQYHEKGYPFAQIAPVITSDEHTINVSVFIFEGEQIKVNSIAFDGVTLSGERMKNVLLLKEGRVYNPDLLSRDQEALTEFYGALGYLAVVIKKFQVAIDKESNRADIVVPIEEGEKTEIGTIEIEGTDEDTKIVLSTHLGIHTGDPYNEIDIFDARFKIIDYYRNIGFTNIDVNVQRTIDRHKAHLVFTVKEGGKKVFGKTVITGNKKTKYEVIQRELLHETGQPYSFRILSTERQRLYKLGLFTDVNIRAVRGENAQNDILIEVQEGNAGYVEFGIGYAEYERLRGAIEVGYKNLWGMNRTGTVRTELSSLEERYILQYRDPWLLGIELPLRAFFLFEDTEEIDIDNRETRYRLKRYTVSAGVEKELTRSIKAAFYYEFSLVKTFDVQPDIILSKEDIGTLAISGIKPSIFYDTRDDPVEPRKGVLAGISLKITPDILFSESNFIKMSASGNVYRALHRRLTLAVSVRGGLAYGFDDTDELPLVERFFLGGRSSVRGYDEDELGPLGSDGNPTGGNAFLMSNIELRTVLTRNIGLVAFLDMGNVWIETNDLDLTDLKYTTGIGLRYNTPVGPLRVDYGFKLDREPIESRSEFHFSIGHMF